MASKFHGVIGFAESVETSRGVWEDVITERKYFGDVLRNTRKLDDDGKVNDNISVGNSISILANPYAVQNFVNMKYIAWLGNYWVVSDVQVVSNLRLTIRLGGLYHGDTLGATDSSGETSG